MPRSARKEGYSRRHRFTTRGAFGPVLRGTRKLRGRLCVVHVAAAPDGNSRLGIALTKRLVPSSSERNRLKRLAREIFRRHVVKQSGFDCVVMLRQKFSPDQAAPIAAELMSHFDQLKPDGAA
jgi:ribonuclease P protein component